MQVKKKVCVIIFLKRMRKWNWLYWIISFIVKVWWLSLTEPIVDDSKDVKILATCTNM